MSIRVQTDGGNAPLIPDVAGLTSIVGEKLRSGAFSEAFDRVSGHLRDDGYAAPNIETQLSFIRSLRVVAGGGSVRDLTVDELKSLEDEICRTIGERVNQSLPGGENPYSNLAAWLGSTTRSAPVEIFTTNYDLLTEQALERFRIPYFDGFSGTRKAFLDSHSIDHDELPARWARLWKMHGWINWVIDESNQLYRGEISVNNCIIHPSHLKYDESRRMPYLVMIDRLRSFIKKPSNVLVTCGYSFRDEHLNASLLESLTGNPRSAVFGLLYGDLEDHPEAVKIASTTGNLSLLARNGAVIGTRKGLWDSNGIGVISWLGAITLEDAPNGDAKVARFRLGDFDLLGKFFASLIGRDNSGGNHAG